MAQVYVVSNDGRSASMERVRCKSETAELQDLLENNYDLLPGDQIEPDDPRRWLLIKREMPVPSPSTALDRWSIDFFFVDQDALPTFVECKRCSDTRSRREVVGQMLEYAANGHHYWTAQQLKELAEKTAESVKVSLQAALDRLAPTDNLDADAFFDRVQQNLREGQLRIVFFLEDSLPELRSVVDFLNKQMERSEVLLVEARLYAASGGQRIVVPLYLGIRIRHEWSNGRSCHSREVIVGVGISSHFLRTPHPACQTRMSQVSGRFTIRRYRSTVN